jgi:SAM-dependent methyltransferase
MSAPGDRPVGFGERVLLALSRDPGAPDYSITTTEYTLDNALDFALKTVPDFPAIVRGKSVLDYGCGPGWQAVAMHQQCGARRVVGIDINATWIAHARELAERVASSDAVTFINVATSTVTEKFDVVLSLNAMEHFDDPEAHVKRMRGLVAPGGRVVISFAEPWYSHGGSHMSFFTKVPWVNVLFTERTVMAVRSRFRSDGATRYEEVEGGLNRMTLRRFERIMRTSGLRIEHLKFHGARGLPVIDKVPFVREFLVGAATCILRN